MDDRVEPAELVALPGRVAVVTGAARGIGLRVATLLAEAGASVCLSDRDQDRLTAAVDALQARDLDVTAHRADVTAMARGFGEPVLAGYARRSTLGRIATPDDVARTVLFLVCDLGGFVNGEVIRMAGGP
jgi:NAD(P)-dependent dehydrogenase (short-subunit alcohol dehydrogenase family)